MSSYFKFGRTFNGFIVVNIDFASLYGELGLVMVPPARGRPNLYSRINHDEHNLVLTRRNLRRDSLDISFEQITLTSFSENYVRREHILRASIIVFLEEDGRTKILKNRYF